MKGRGGVGMECARRMSRVCLVVAVVAAYLLLAGCEGATGSKTQEREPEKSQETQASLWRDADFEPAFDQLKDAGVTEVTLDNPENTLPFYNRSGPLTYQIWHVGSYEYGEPPVAYSFGEPQSRSSQFRTVFIYGDDKVVAKGARTFDVFGNVVAEARFVRDLIEEGQFEVEELHYRPDARSDVGYRDVRDMIFKHVDGTVVFRCRSEFRESSKMSEYETSGKKTQDYYFLWPYNITPVQN